MKRIRKWYRLLTALLTAMLCLSYLNAPVLAYDRVDVQKACSLTVYFGEESQGFSDVSFRIYKVASMSDSVHFTLCEPFDEYSISLEGLDGAQWNALAQTLEGYVAADDIQPMQQVKTRADGNALFSGLQTGLYLVLGDVHRKDEQVFTPESFLVTLPYLDQVSDQWSYDAIADCKFEMKEEPSPEDKITLSVRKVWKDQGAEAQRPENITVQLLKNGQAYETVQLTANNNWQYTWKDLPADAQWNVVERDIPAEYTVSLERDGSVFTLTNTRRQNPTDPDEPGKTTPEGQNTPGTKQQTEAQSLSATGILPQTGTYWWPVPLLVCAGLILCAIGWVKYHRKDHDES